MTLAVRIERHAKTAAALAGWLEDLQDDLAAALAVARDAAGAVEQPAVGV